MIGLCKSDDVFRTRSRIMKIPGGYRTIEKTGIVRSLSLLRSIVLSLSLFLFSLAPSRALSVFTGSLTRRCTKVARTSFWEEGGSIQSEDINNKIWYNGSIPRARNTMQCLCRGLSDVVRSREKYRPRWDRPSVCHADSRAGLLQRWPAGSRGRWFREHGPRFRSSVLISPRERFTFEIRPGYDFSWRPERFSNVMFPRVSRVSRLPYLSKQKRNRLK